MFDVYAAYRNSDMKDGLGEMVMDRVFAVEMDAHAYIDTQPGISGRCPEHGWQNSDLNDWQVRPILVLEHLEDGPEWVFKQNLHNAYAKLSKAEKAAIEKAVREALTP